MMTHTVTYGATTRLRVRRRSWRGIAYGAGAIATLAVTLGLASPALATDGASAQVVDADVDAPVAQDVTASVTAESLVGLGLLNEQARADLVNAYLDDDAAGVPSETTALAYNSRFADGLIEALSR